MGRNRGRPSEVVHRIPGEGLPVGWRPADLQPTSRAILQAAHELLVRKGAAGVTMAAVAREGNVDVTTVAYHFRTREGLIEALMDSLYAEPVADLMEQARTLPDVHDRWRAYIQAIRSITTSDPAGDCDEPVRTSADTQAYFDIAALALRSATLRQRLAQLQGWKVDAFLAELGPVEVPDERALGEFIFAAVDGIELHHALAGADFPLAGVLTLLEQLIDSLLE